MADSEIQSKGFPTEQEVVEATNVQQPYLNVLQALICPPSSGGRMTPSTMQYQRSRTADHYLGAIKAAAKSHEEGAFKPPLPVPLAELVVRAASNESEVSTTRSTPADDNDDSLMMRERVTDSKKVAIAQRLLWGIVGHWLGSGNAQILKDHGGDV